MSKTEKVEPKVEEPVITQEWIDQFPSLKAHFAALGIDWQHIKDKLELFVSLHPELKRSEQEVVQFFSEYLNSTHYGVLFRTVGSELYQAWTTGQSEVQRDSSSHF